MTIGKTPLFAITNPNAISETNFTLLITQAPKNHGNPQEREKPFA